MRKVQTNNEGKVRRLCNFCHCYRQLPGRTGRSSIDVLSDDDLLYIFNLYRRALNDYYTKIWPWHTLVHTCQRWRHVLFAWPRHLDLRLHCKSKTAAAKARDVWPTLPIVIHSVDKLHPDNQDDIVDALEHRDRIVQITLAYLSRSQLERCAAWMNEPFPVMQSLDLFCNLPDSDDTPVITDTFLGGSAPCLRRIELSGISVSTLKFLSSAPNLVYLNLWNFTGAAHISPGQVATCVSPLKKLEDFSIFFESHRSFSEPTNQCPPPPRTVLPSLVTFSFRGVSEYLEDLISRVAAPLLECLSLQFFDQPILAVPQLSHFLHRIEKLRSPLHARIVIYEDKIHVSMTSSVAGILSLGVFCTGLDRQISLSAQFCAQCLPRVSHLELTGFNHTQTDQQGSRPWQRLLRPFNSLQTIFVWEDELEVQIASALGELTWERVAEVLPMLHTIWLAWFDRVESLVIPLLNPFIDARRLLDRPVEVEIVRCVGDSSWRSEV
jgi:hypothetical protein